MVEYNYFLEFYSLRNDVLRAVKHKDDVLDSECVESFLRRDQPCEMATNDRLHPSSSRSQSMRYVVWSPTTVCTTFTEQLYIASGILLYKVGTSLSLFFPFQSLHVLSWEQSDVSALKGYI